MKKIICRKAYYRKPYRRADGTYVKGAYVKPRYIRDRGKKGKGPQLIPKLKKGFLTRYGYSNVKNLSLKQRRTALRKAIQANNPTVIFQRVNAIYVFNKNTNPSLSAKYKADRNWIRRTYLKK